MLEIAILRNEKERVLTGLTKKNVSQGILDSINEIINLDDQRKSVQSKLDEKLAESNNLPKLLEIYTRVVKRRRLITTKLKLPSSKKLPKNLKRNSIV